MKQINQILGNTDIYLVDQIVKGRYQNSDVILDAGSGLGRNLHWFYNNDFAVYGVDKDKACVDILKNVYAKQESNFHTSTIEEIDFNGDFFNHIICNAVLHFAKDKKNFKEMFSELFRVLKPKGSLFIRVASDIGIEDKIISVSEGVYNLPDGTKRFLLTKSLLKELQNQHHFNLLEPVKTVNVNDQRCMTTLVLQK